MQNPQNLRVHRLATDLVVDVSLALDERRCRRVPGLRAQAIRAATSIATNISEGCSRNSEAEFAHFIEIAIGSALELDTQLRIAVGALALSPGAGVALSEKLATVRKMLISLLKRLRGGTTRPPPARTKRGKAPPPP